MIVVNKIIYSVNPLIVFPMECSHLIIIRNYVNTEGNIYSDTYTSVEP